MVLADRVTVATSKCPSAVALIERADAGFSPRISSQLDDEGQRQSGLSDSRDAEVRPWTGGCRPTLGPAALPVAELSCRAAPVTGIGVRQQQRPGVSRGSIRRTAAVPGGDRFDRGDGPEPARALATRAAPALARQLRLGCPR
jgi:hypothetical protein